MYVPSRQPLMEEVEGPRWGAWQVGTDDRAPLPADTVTAGGSAGGASCQGHF